MVMICPNCNSNNLPGAEECDECGQDLTQLDKPTAQDRIERSLMEDTVGSLHPPEPITTKATTTVRDAIQIMLTRNIGALLIIDDEAHLLGIFSERDLLTKVAHETNPPLDRPVSDFMTTTPQTVTESHSLAFVLHQMDGGEYRHMPVIQNGKPVGVLSVRDMLHHFTRLCRT